MDSSREQFGHIYDQYIDKIYRFVYLKVNSQEIAEDITSKVFIRGWEAYQKQIQNSKFKIQNEGAFLYQIARNAVIDYYREKGRTRVVSAEISPEMVDLGTSAQEKAMLGSDVSAVKKALFGLKKEYQDVIIWHYLEDMPISEVAKLAGKSENNIRVILHRGLQELKTVINQQIQAS